MTMAFRYGEKVTVELDNFPEKKIMGTIVGRGDPSCYWLVKVEDQEVIKKEGFDTFNVYWANITKVRTHKIEVGQKYDHYGMFYMIADCGSSNVILVNTNTGVRWHEPVKVEDWMNISDEEFCRLTCNRSDSFKLVKDF